MFLTFDSVFLIRHPGESRYRIHTSLRVIDDRPIHLAPRQRGEGGAQRVSVGRVRGTRSLGAERLVKVAAVWLCGTAKKEITGTPLTLPLLRNGPLPLPASRVRGVWAMFGRGRAGKRYVNPIAAFAGMTKLSE